MNERKRKRKRKRKRRAKLVICKLIRGNLKYCLRDLHCYLGISIYFKCELLCREFQLLFSCYLQYPYLAWIVS